jgi:drug/metabolite transporter (DMT)-like permease
VTTRTASAATALERKARALLIGSTLFWGLTFPLLRAVELTQRASGLHGSDVALACADMAVRFGLAALVLLAIYGRGLARISALEWSQGGGLAFFAGVGMGLQTLGLAWTDASITAFLTQLYTLIVPLIVAVRDRRRPTGRVMIACVLVLAGAAMLSPGLFRHFTLGTGEIVIIASTFFMACQIVWVERPIYAENRAGVVTLIMFALLALGFGLAFFVVGGTPGQAQFWFGTPQLWTLILALVLFSTVVNFLIMNAWQPHVSATEAGLIYCLEPVIATVLASFLPGWISRFASVHYANEMLTWSLLIGGGLIVSATVLVATEKRA